MMMQRLTLGAAALAVTLAMTPGGVRLTSFVTVLCRCGVSRSPQHAPSSHPAHTRASLVLPPGCAGTVL